MQLPYFYASFIYLLGWACIINALFVSRAFEPNVNFRHVSQFCPDTLLNAVIKLYTFPLTSYSLLK